MNYIKKLSLLAIFPIFFQFGIAHADTASDAAARNSGYGIGGAGFGNEYQVDDAGNIVKDSNGNPIIKRRGSSLDSSLKILNSTTGITNVSVQNTPGKSYSGGNSAGGADFQVNSGVDFRCEGISKETPKKLVISGVRFKVSACTINSEGEGTVTLASCYKGTQSAHTCPADSDYGDPLDIVTNEDFKNDGTLSVGVGCASTGMCRLTAKGKLTVKASSTDLDSAQNRESDLRGGLLNSVSKGNMAEKSLDYAKSYQECTQKNLDDGTFATCDKSYTVGVDLTKSTPTTGTDSSTCSGSSERVCTQEAIETTNTRKMCYREFEVSSHRKDYEITVKQCYRETDPWNQANSAGDTWFGDWLWTGTIPESRLIHNSCADVDDSLKISTTEPRIVCVADNRDVAILNLDWQWLSNDCEKNLGEFGWFYGKGLVYRQTTTYYAVKEPNVTVNEYEPPLKPGSVCNQQVESDSFYFTCSGNWIARTLPDDQCSLKFYDNYTGSIIQKDYDEFLKKGCGYCTYKKESSICSTGNSTSTCGSDELSNCSILEKNVKAYSGGNTGVVTSQEEAYNCVTKKSVCVAWDKAEGSSYCLNSNLAHGTDALPPSQGVDPNWSKVAMASEMTDQINSGAKNSETPEILLFTGSPMFCHRPVGLVGGALQKNCCKTSITRPSAGVLTQEGCSEDEAKLASARRKGTTHYVGEWCSDEIDLLFGSMCVERSEGYCAFNGLLARVVQEQGRQQLSDIVHSGVSNKAVGNLNFKYYDTTDTGAWTSAIEVNGLKTAAWSWPAFCADSSKAAQQQVNNPTGPQCGGAISVWMATCTKSDCGALPSNPGVSETNWDLIKVDPLTASLNVASKYSVVKGVCNTSTYSCAYEVTAVPPTSGGMYLAQSDLSWQLFANVSEDTAAQSIDFAAYQAACRNKFGDVAQCNSVPASYQNASSNVGDVMIMPKSISGATGSDIPGTVPVGVSADGGKSFVIVNVTPDGAARDYPVSVGGKNKNITIQVTCSKLTGICTGKAFVQVAITTISWGSGEHPDCSGFTLSQFGALNFDKMDLSEWVNSLSIKDSGTASKSELTQTAMDQASSFNAAYNGGAGSVSGSNGTNVFVNLSKNKGFGPFNTQLSFPAVWPYASAPESERDLVLSASVDWGDCSNPILNQSQTGNSFMFSHTYGDPKTIWSACGKGAQEKDFLADIKVTVQLRSRGTKTYTLSVVNYWGDSPQDGKGSTSSDPVVNTVPAKDARLPLTSSPVTESTKK